MRGQLLLSSQFRSRSDFGGSLSVGKRKGPRPIATRRAMHVVLRSSQARGKWSLYRYKPEIRSVVDRFAHRFGIRMYEYANAGSHIHLVKDKLQASNLSIRVLADALNTSPSQVARLLEEDRASKQMLQLLQLAELAGYHIEFNLKKKSAV